MFTIIAFAGIYDFSVLMELSFTTYIVKLIISITDIPFMKIAKRIKD